MKLYPNLWVVLLFLGTIQRYALSSDSDTNSEYFHQNKAIIATLIVNQLYFEFSSQTANRLFVHHFKKDFQPVSRAGYQHQLSFNPIISALSGRKLV
jgi:hypothetical protein